MTKGWNVQQVEGYKDEERDIWGMGSGSSATLKIHEDERERDYENPIPIASEFRECTRVDYNIVDSAGLLPELLARHVITVLNIDEGNIWLNSSSSMHICSGLHK
ncbi:hypothetical protein ACTXT7_011931 [Hymenolepis weldensis]